MSEDSRPRESNPNADRCRPPSTARSPPCPPLKSFHRPSFSPTSSPLALSTHSSSQQWHSTLPSRSRGPVQRCVAFDALSTSDAHDVLYAPDAARRVGVSRV